MAQDLFRGHRVRIIERMPVNMSHFQGGLEAIVQHSYADAFPYNCHLGDDEKFSLLLLRDRQTTSAWYCREQLTLLPNSRDEGEAILQAYQRSQMRDA